MDYTIINKIYKIIVNGKVHRFTTSLTEREFYATLDAVYGVDNYKTLEVDFEMEGEKR